ncbi:hypothetical protein RHS01_05110 [Rhizoctonia solani]|uniref:Phosphatidate phosphatase APP1 catalytic domain-containing protein n=1 Tax=Rhizoctonia solani TaxID=456999 RepID=A0A8H7IDY9_9AGAM|nr:hypothetical protein RHS01_05110 [Rhizoctonia solani]
MSSRSGDAGILDDIVANIVSILGIVKRNGPEEENVRSRVAMFLGFMKVNERAVLVSRSLEAAIGEQGTREIVWKVLTSSEDQRVFEARTFVPADSGWVVISDVDDTIKVSQVNNRIALLRNTFVADPSAVPGMPELYASLNTQLNNRHGSTSPPHPGNYTLFTRLSQRSRTIPAWPAHPARHVPRRDARDSTQKDPESYGEIARKWPNWVGAIWIRVVQGVDERKEKDLNDPKRFAKAFEKVDSRIWKTFIDPKELQAASRD